MTEVLQKLLEKIKSEKSDADREHNTIMKENPDAQRFTRGYVAGLQFAESRIIKLMKVQEAVKKTKENTKS